MTYTAPPAAITITAALLAVLIAAYDNGGILPLADVAAEDAAALRDRGLIWVDAEVIEIKAGGLQAVQRYLRPDYVGQVAVI